MRVLPTRSLLPPLLMLALTLLFFRQLVFSENILARGDAYNYFYPYWDIRNAAFRNGELPLWTNDLFMGAPLLANPQLGTYYPLNWLTAPFPAPTAIKISIGLHCLLAGLGMLLLYRQTVGPRVLPAMTAAILYSFGGYLGAHVEQINQLQGLAWLPILFALCHRMLTGHSPARAGLLLAMAWAMQIFTGHTQTVFISGVGLGVYTIALSIVQGNARRIGRPLLLLAGAGLTALPLAAAQILPTLELSGMSIRGAGLSPREASAFSLPPSLLGRALLPSYDGQIFGEYTAYLGLIGLGLALYGAMAKKPTVPSRRVWIAIASLGLLLALGRYNPLYLLLAELPGFNLFRVPARYLALFALGMSMLAGMGLDSLRHQDSLNHRRKAIIIGLLAAVILLTRFVLKPDPSHFFMDSAISDSSLALWTSALLLLLALLTIPRPWTPFAALILLLAELLLAAHNLPYNDLAPPDSYSEQRFTISQLLAYQAEETAPGRTLSISQLYFDPGDITALRARYDRLGMGPRQQFQALDTVKKRETLMPNLALTWGIPTIDGFGGGITPTIYYAQFTSLLLPDGAPRTTDGRLGEGLAQPICRGACLPDLRYLQMSGATYLITDKTHDIWREDIAYDTALADYWQSVDSLPFADDRYDQVRILHSQPLPGRGDSQTLPQALLLTVTDEDGANSILAKEHSIIAITLVNSQLGIFQQLQPPPLERALSSDIKLYRIPQAHPRAYLAQHTRILPDSWQGREQALSALRENELSVIHGGPELDALNTDSPGQVDITAYDATRIELTVQSDNPAYLILSDAHYPGWQAAVNDQPTTIHRANVMFRALQVPAGQSAVIFTFEPRLWQAALVISAASWILSLLLLIFLPRLSVFSVAVNPATLPVPSRKETAT